MILEASTLIDDERFLKQIEKIEEYCQNISEKSWELAKKYNKELPYNEVEVSILLTDDEKIQELNKNYRGKNKPTNVISFASIDSEELDIDFFTAGDIIISYDTVLRESENIGFKNHFTHLLVHGMLHLAGFDHINDDDADNIEAIEV